MQARPIIEQLRRRITPDLYRQIRRLWKTHVTAEDARDIDTILTTLTDDCVFEIVQTGDRWDGHEGAARFHWPVPEVFDLSGMRSIGYAGEVVLPLELVPRDGGGAIRLSGVVDLGICEEICVPVSLRLAADLPVPGAPDAAIRAALDAVPPQVTAPVRCRVEPIRDGLRVTAEITHPALGPGEVAVIEAGDPSVWVSEPVLARAGPVLTAVADLVPAEARPFALDRSAVVITLIGGGTAVELKGCPAG